MGSERIEKLLDLVVFNSDKISDEEANKLYEIGPIDMPEFFESCIAFQKEWGLKCNKHDQLSNEFKQCIEARVDAAIELIQSNGEFWLNGDKRKIK